MDSQNKAIDGIVMKERGGRSGFCLLVLRVMALVLSLGAAIVLGLDKDTKLVPVQLVDSLPPINVPVEAKWHYLSAFVFFVVSNAIASSYAAVSLLLSIGGKRSMVLCLITADLLMVALLFCSNGAATAIGLIGYEGNSHVRWNKVCNIFGRFCNQVSVAIAISLLASIAFLLLVMLNALRLHRKSNSDAF